MNVDFSLKHIITIIIFIVIIFLLTPILLRSQSTDAWKFIAYGDTRTNDREHRAVLEAMVDNTPDYRFIINAGDVVEDGTSTSDWETWQKACDDILGGTGQTQVPPKYMAVAGNHDNLDNSDGMSNWKHYLSGQSEQFGNNGEFFVMDYENARFIFLNSDGKISGEQRDFLIDAINNNTKTWLFAVWHHPIFPFGAKSYEDYIHDMWGVPLYEAGADIIFVGHAHYYTRSIKLELNGNEHPPADPLYGTAQVIAGNGGAPLYDIDPGDNAYMLAGSTDEFGYSELVVEGNTLTYRHITINGVVVDEEVYTANPKSEYEIDNGITASADNPPDEIKDMAFDGDNTTKWLAFDDAAWIQYDYYAAGSYARVIDGYRITSANDYPERDPRDWRLLGSNDGSNWTILDSRTEETFFSMDGAHNDQPCTNCHTFPSSRMQTKNYSFNNVYPYRMYRLDISSNYDPSSADAVQLAEIQFLENNSDLNPSLYVTKTTYDVNETIVVNYTNLPGNSTDWVGVYETGTPNESYLQYFYSNGAVNGTMHFNGLSIAGEYEARLFFNDSYTLEYDVSFTVVGNNNNDDYELTVNNGSGDGNYQEGQSVTISADAPAAGKVFNQWIINSGDPLIADVYSETTILTMPAMNATVTAQYQDGEDEAEMVNLVLPSNGGLLESFTSEYSIDWAASMLTDGITNDDGWSSEANPEPEQEFIYSFRNGQSAMLHEAVIYSGTAEGVYFSKDVEVWTSQDGISFTNIASGTLENRSNTSITLNLGDTEAKKIKLVITSGYRTDYWELGEFVVNGTLKSITDDKVYSLTVENGSGDGEYPEGEEVTITANASPSGKMFDRWVTSSGNPVIKNTQDSITTLTMPASASTITATYKAMISNQSPIVAFTQPLAGTFLSPDIGVIVEAADPDGTISNVALYINGSLVRTEGAAPYEWGTANNNQDDPALMNLSPGTYELRAVATDNDGASASAAIDVIIDDTIANEGYNVYYGLLHSHTAISDGAGTPESAYEYARDNGKLDFFGIADHDYWPDDMTDDDWNKIKNAADSYNDDGTFVTFWGFEWTSDSEEWQTNGLALGHLTIINSEDYCISTYEPHRTLNQIVDWMDARDVVAFFNHPGQYETSFDQFNFNFTDKIVGMELWNRTDDYYSGDGYYKNDGGLGFYDEAISRGWYIGATGGQDNHDADWGTMNEWRMCVLAPENTREALLAAMKVRRFYSSRDKNLALSFKCNGDEMGTKVKGGSLNFQIAVSDEDNQTFSKIELLKNGIVIKSWDLNSEKPVLNYSAEGIDGDYYYVRIYQSGQNGWQAISSPIFVDGEADVNQIPVVAFTEPVTDTLNSPNIGVEVEASDTDGNIAEVALYIDDKLVRIERDSPYEWGTANSNEEDQDLLNLQPGIYRLHALARDNDNNTASDTIYVTVKEERYNNNDTLTLPVRGAFYYPWYPQTWSVNGEHVSYNVELGYYSSDDAYVVDQHIDDMDYAKIDVAIASWWGVGRQNEDFRFPMLLDRTVSAGSDLKWAAYYEMEGFSNPTVEELKSDLAYLMDRYTSHDAYARVEGKPVIFVYNADDRDCEVSERWLEATEGKWYVNLKVFGGFRDCASQPDSWHQYGPGTPASHHTGYSYVISPGFWRADQESPLLMRDPVRWNQNVRDMIASEEPWQLVTTFNEWGEGTAIERCLDWRSDTEYGIYLDALHNDGVDDDPTSLDDKQDIPDEFMLARNYPNPFNPSTTIKYDIAQGTHVTINIYNMLGKLVAVLVNSKRTPGSYTATFNASNLPSGVYILQMKAGAYMQRHKMMLVK